MCGLAAGKGIRTYGCSTGNELPIGDRFLRRDTCKPPWSHISGQSVACFVLEECMRLCEYTQARTAHTSYGDKFTQVNSSCTETCNVRKSGPCAGVKAHRHSTAARQRGDAFDARVFVKGTELIWQGWDAWICLDVLKHKLPEIQRGLCQAAIQC